MTRSLALRSTWIGLLVIVAAGRDDRCQSGAPQRRRRRAGWATQLASARSPVRGRGRSICSTPCRFHAADTLVSRFAARDSIVRTGMRKMAIGETAITGSSKTSGSRGVKRTTDAG